MINMIKCCNNILVLTALTTLLFCLSGCSQKTDQSKESAQPKRPNVLLIVADDMGYSDISPFGGEIATPTLDELTKEGLQLTNFHVLPTCSPSRSVLLSGVDNHRAGIGTMAERITEEVADRPGYEGYLNFDVAALPEVMKAAGYNTYMAGKWHLGDDPNTVPHSRGFDETFVLLQGGGSHLSDRKGVSPSQSMVYHQNGKPIDSLPDDFYSTKNYTDMILEWIKQDSNTGNPFFAYLAYTAPHDPLHAPKEYIDKYKGVYDAGWDDLREKRLQSLKDLGIINKDAKSFPRLPTVPAWDELSSQERAEAARDMEVYAAMIDYMDDQIKRIIDYLKETGEYENTLIIYFSDNGANGGTKEDYPDQTEEFLNQFDNSLDNRGLANSFIEMGPGWAQASMAPSRMFKGFPAEGGVRAPLLIKLPGKMVNAGNMNNSFQHINSIMPTILEVANVEQQGLQFEGRQVYPIQGSSMLTILEGKDDPTQTEVIQVGYELFGMKAYHADGWKILLMPKPYGTGEWELFNLEEDPSELNDLSKENPEKLSELVSLWEQYKKDNGVLDISLNTSDAD
jgi:arylsulfatase A-like enzyme